MKKFKLSDKKQGWAESRDTTLVGTPLVNNAAIEIKYQSKIDKLLDAMAKDTEKEIMKLFKSDAAKGNLGQDASISSLARIVMNKLAAKWTKAFSANAKNISNLMVNQVNDQSKRSVGFSLKQLSGGLNIKTSALNPRLRDILTATTEESTSLIKSLASNYMEQVKGDVLRSITQPDEGGLAGLQGRIHKQLTERFKKHKNKAKNVALDQTRKAYNNLNAQRMQDNGVSEFRWKHAGGSKKPRQDHIDMNNNVYRFDDLPVVDKRTGERGIPGQAINCFPYDSKLDFFQGVNRAYRHFYTGELTSIVTNSGKTVKCTPNHPVLTDTGFVSANLINVGDNIVAISEHGFDTLNGYSNGTYSSIGEVFEFLNLIGLRKSTPITGGELHGDVTDENIDIVSSDWRLLDMVDIESGKEFYKLFLSQADKVITDFDRSCYSSAFKFIKGATLAPDSIVSGASKILSLTCGEFRHSNATSLAAISGIYSAILEGSNYNRSANIKALGDSLNTLTSVEHGYYELNWNILSAVRFLFEFGNVKTPASDLYAEIVGITHKLPSNSSQSLTSFQSYERVVDKRVSVFSSHVYNLEMDNGIYYTSKIAVSNCKCYMVPVISFTKSE